jgi:hypothetical protein
MINGIMTLSGAWHKLRDDPILKFLITSLSFYGMSTFEGPMMSIKTVNGSHSGPRKKISPEIIAGLVRLITSGVPYEASADAVGIGETTLYGWLKRGKKSTRKDCPYAKLVKEIRKARADAITRNVAIIQKAASKTWQAAAWWLERRESKHFGANKKELNDLRAENTRLKERLSKKTSNGTDSPEVISVLLSPAVQSLIADKKS